MHGDRFSYSKYFPDTGIDGIFGFSIDSSPILVQNNIWGNKAIHDNYNSSMILEIEDGIANFPILLVNGTNIVPRYEQAGLITEKMKLPSTKSFICRTKDDGIKM
jgi:hypothetical protein